MRKLLLFIIFATGHAAAFAAAPVIYYSDLTSGPGTGGQDNKGAFVTIAGTHFGSSRGGGSVTIGGGQADNYVIWTDSRIVFQLGAGAATGNIVVTTPQGASNGVPFTVRGGNIYFVSATSPNDPGSGTYVDPWRSPKSFMDVQAPGDICYVEEGVYAGVYGTKWNYRVKNNVDYYRGPGGTADRPIAWCGYPGHTAVFQADGTFPENGTFSLRADYIRVCNLTLKGYGNSNYVSNIMNTGCAFINCRIGYQQSRCYGMIGIESGSDIQIYGNEITGGASLDKSDHCIYFDGNATNVDVAWNYFHDNRIDVGPVFSYNGPVGSITIRNNIIDCRNSNTYLDVLGQWGGAATTSTRFYNNIVFPAVSYNRYGTIYVYTGSLDAYNNTFVNGIGDRSTPIFDGRGAVSVTSVNNIFYNQPTVPAYGTNITHSHNLYWNVQGSVSETGGLTGDPLFVDPANYDFHLSTAPSPAWRSGNAAETSAGDYELTPRASPPCRGAFEFSAVFSIAGTVKDGSDNGLSGVTVTLSGGAAQTTAGDGSYRFTGLPEQSSYTVIPSKAGMTFGPVTFSTSSLGADITDADFVGTSAPPPAYAISGFVRDGTGAAVAGVSMTLSGGMVASTTTANDGSYQFTNLPEQSSYTVIPAKTGMTFAPVSFSTTSLGAMITNADFTGTLLPPPVYAIRGYIKDGAGVAVAGVNMALSGGVAASTTTASDGSYQFTNLPERSSYTVIPSKAGMTFAPVSFSTASLNATITNADFTGTLLPPPVYAIKGFVKDGTGTAIAGVSMALSGRIAASTTTTSDGSYQFADLPEQSSYTITPSKTGMTFAPVVFSTSGLSATITNANFTGTLLPPPVYAIKGFVKDGTGTAIAGVSMAISGGVTASTVTASDGSYQFTNLPERSSYTVIPAKTGMTFAPVSFSTASLVATITNASFTGTLLPPPVYAIRGAVKDGSGVAIAGVSMALSGRVNISTTTASDGSYQFTNLPEQSSYTVIPSKAGMTFVPVSFSTASLTATITNADFTGTLLPPPVYAIRGSVKDGTGTAIAGVSMALSGRVTASTTTANDGSYQFTNLPEQSSYTVIPSKTGMTFAPVSFSTAGLVATITNADFVGTAVPPPVYAIKGFVKDGTGTALAGVSMALSGRVTASTTTASDGSYQFANLLERSSYTVTPAKAGMTFAPVSFSTASLTATITNADFTGTLLPPPVYAIKGFVKDGTGSALAGVSMALSGGVTASTVTADDGSYQFADLLERSSYTVTPSKTGLTFAPAAISTASLVATITDANFVGTAVSPPPATAPVIYYSDLTSGPNTGGQDNKGAFVTLSGIHFGPSRDGGSVTIGGGQADNYVIWTDNKIVFQLGAGAATGNIVVTTPQGASNGVPFTVRSGNIYFVSAASPNDPGSGTYANPWRSPKSFMDRQAPGDICYIENGTYTGVYGARWNGRYRMNVDYYRAPGGTADRPIVWCGYPGHTAVFQANGTTATNGTFSLRANYIRVCNLTLKGYGNSYYVCNISNNGCAFINCRIGYQRSRCYGMIGIESGSSIQIYGNEITGATSQDKSDHCIYFDGNPANVDVAWNYFHDNRIDVGPVFSYSGSVGAVTIRNNVIDCRNSNRNLDLLAQAGTGSATKTQFYNNVVFPTVSNSRSGTIAVNSGSLDAYNNTFANAVTVNNTPLFDGRGARSLTSVNNIFYNQPTVRVYGSNVAHSYNLYYRVSGSVSETGGLAGDPLFAGPAGSDFHIAYGSSPACRNGSTAKMSASDCELTPRASPPCRGAYEYIGTVTVARFLSLQPVASEDLKGARAYPVPFNPARGAMTIDRLTAAATIRLFNVAGELIRTIDYSDGSGRTAWDGANDSGSRVASGVYLILIDSPAGKRILKIAVEK